MCYYPPITLGEVLAQSDQRPPWLRAVDFLVAPHKSLELWWGKRSSITVPENSNDNALRSWQHEHSMDVFPLPLLGYYAALALTSIPPVTAIVFQDTLRNNLSPLVTKLVLDPILEFSRTCPAELGLFIVAMWILGLPAAVASAARGEVMINELALPSNTPN